jgi:DNA invertase Pin-like site-specific DNA recombinase
MSKLPLVPDETGPTPAAGYVRVSTGRQAREGLSLEEQERRVRAYVDDQDFSLVELFVEAGVRGRKADRPELERLLARLDEIDVLVTPRLDRLGRSLRHLLDVFDQLEAAGVQLVSLSENIDTSTSVGKLLRAVLSALAEFESDVIGERVAAVTAARAAEGRFPGGRFPPYGYRREPGKGIVPEPTQAAVVRRIFRETVAGRSQREIVRRLDADGIPTQNGTRWTQGDPPHSRRRRLPRRRRAQGSGLRERPARADRRSRAVGRGRPPARESPCGTGRGPRTPAGGPPPLHARDAALRPLRWRHEPAHVSQGHRGLRMPKPA